ncbi:hypothetical protein HDV03_002909 [Kappamyces sp. JEL0829]|nr:hypothetical protein HDV03_002909 [Kappamyces sp. JEL0829]
MEERNALVFSQRSEWITTLYASFQDDENLYLVMEYVSGASFRALLNNRETIMGETEARFYIAEMVLALAEPENYLLDATGHIKLADFGSCIRYTKGKMISSQIAVGTPDYISPEILRANEGKAEYGVEVDWWSLGIILYELLCDEVPFYAESLVGTYGKIMNHETTFAFPNEPELTENCQDLIKRYQERLGRLDAEEIKNHKWFDGIDWANIRKSNRRASHIVATAPFIPELSGPEDTRYFEDEENETKKFVKKALVKTKEFSGNSLAFVGYNYVHNSTAFIQYPGMTAADASASASRRSATASPAEVQELKNQLAKNAEVTRHLQATLAALELQKAELENEGKSAKLAHEMSISKNRDLESKLSNVETLYASATSNGNRVQELTEIKTQLESDIAKLNADIRCQKEDAIKVQHSLAENIKSKTVLETKIKDQQDQISALQQEREALKTTIAVTTDSSLQRSQEFAEVTAKLAKLTLDYEASVVQNQAKTSLIQEKTKQLEEHAEAIAQLEKTEAIHKLEIAAAASKYSEAELEVARLNQEIQELNKNAQSTSSSELESLKTQLQSQQAARAKTVEELASIQKSKALLEIEVSSLNKSRIISQQAQQELAEQILELDKKVKEQELVTEALAADKLSLEAQLAAVKGDLAKSQSAVQELSLAKKELDQILDSRESLYETLLKCNDDLKVKLNLEIELAAALEERISKLSEDLATERKLRIVADSENSKSLMEIARLQGELRLVTNNPRLMDLEENILSLQTNHKILLINAANEKSLREQAQQKSQELSQKLDLAKAELNDAIQLVEKSEEDHRLRSASLERESNFYQEKVDELAEKLKVLESENLILRTKVEASGQTPAIRENSLEKKSKSTDKLFSKARMSGIFFKSKDNLHETPEKLVTHDEEQHKRMQSHQSFQSAQSLESMKSALSALVKTQSPITGTSVCLTIVLDFFNPIDGLHGLVKVPKGGKVKKGWRLIYLAFCEDKLISYENHDDYSRELNGTVLCNISCDIFVARSVSQNELIHANARDIDLIFKIQAYTPKINAAGEGEASWLLLTVRRRTMLSASQS